MDDAGAAKATPGIDWPRCSPGWAWRTEPARRGPAELRDRRRQAIERESLEDWRDYLRFARRQLLADLSSAFVEEHFEFYDRKLSGTQEMQPRWKRALGD